MRRKPRNDAESPTTAGKSGLPVLALHIGRLAPAPGAHVERQAGTRSVGDFFERKPSKNMKDGPDASRGRACCWTSALSQSPCIAGARPLRSRGGQDCCPRQSCCSTCYLLRSNGRSEGDWARLPPSHNSTIGTVCFTYIWGQVSLNGIYASLPALRDDLLMSTEEAASLLSYGDSSAS